MKVILEREKAGDGDNVSDSGYRYRDVAEVKAIDLCKVETGNGRENKCAGIRRRKNIEWASDCASIQDCLARDDWARSWKPKSTHPF